MVGGLLALDGSRWDEGCNKCRCHNGRIGCSKAECMSPAHRAPPPARCHSESSCANVTFTFNQDITAMGVTVEQVCRELGSLYVVKNLSSDSSVSMSCEPSLSTNKEIHVAISTEDQRTGLTFVKEITDRIMDLVSKKSANSTVISAIAEVRIQRRQSHNPNDHLVPLLVSAVVVVWALAMVLMLLWFVRRRRKRSAHAGVSTQTAAASSSLAPVAEDNNALHNSVNAAREQLNHIKNPIVKNTPTHQQQHHHLLLHHHLCDDKNAVNAKIRKSDTGSQSEEDEMDKRLQKARFPLVAAYSLVDHTTGKPPHWTSKQDNRQLQSQSVNRMEYIV